MPFAAQSSAAAIAATISAVFNNLDSIFWNHQSTTGLLL
jgi:hypothetical protein